MDRPGPGRQRCCGGPAHAQSVDWRIVDYDITTDARATTKTDITNTSTEVNTTVNRALDIAQSLTGAVDISVSDSLTREVKQSVDQSLTSKSVIRSPAT